MTKILPVPAEALQAAFEISVDPKAPAVFAVGDPAIAVQTKPEARIPQSATRVSASKVASACLNLLHLLSLKLPSGDKPGSLCDLFPFIL